MNIVGIKSVKVFLAIWFVVICCFFVSGCDTKCTRCGFMRGEIVIIQDPNGMQTQLAADGEGCVRWKIPGGGNCDEWIGTPATHGPSGLFC